MKTSTKDKCTICFYKNKDYITMNSCQVATNQKSVCKKLSTNNVNTSKCKMKTIADTSH